jgi:hypothetical protein
MLVNPLFYFFQAAKGGTAGKSLALGFTLVFGNAGIGVGVR